MEQKKIGNFLKELRKEKGITQEQFAEVLGVSGRTVSRWETGNNMPDISLLVAIAEFFEVSIPEVINGERKSENMDEEIKEVAETLSDYASAEKETMIKEVRRQSLIGVVAIVVYCILDTTELVLQNAIFEKMALYCETLAFVTVIMILAHTTGLINKMQKRRGIFALNNQIKKLPKVLQMITVAIMAFGVAVIVNFFLNHLVGL